MIHPTLRTIYMEERNHFWGILIGKTRSEEECCTFYGFILYFGVVIFDIGFTRHKDEK